MSIREFVACCAIVSLSGCLYHARERTDATVANLVAQPYDVMPATALVPTAAPGASPETTVPPAPQGTNPAAPAPATSGGNAPPGAPGPPGAVKVDVRTSK